MQLLRPLEIAVKELPWVSSRSVAGFLNPEAVTFYENLLVGGYEPDQLLFVLPQHNLIYVAVPKAASTRIEKGPWQKLRAGYHAHLSRAAGRSFAGPMVPAV